MPDPAEERELDATARIAADRAARVVVLASGEGTLAQALLDADPSEVQVVAVGTDRPAPVAERAAAAGVPSFCVRPAEHPDRASWDRALTEAVVVHDPALVVCAGFMRLLGPVFLAELGGRVLNSHPALLPSFPGAHAVADALAHGVRVTGTTVHLVDAGVDTGPILAQAAVEVEPDDDEQTLHERIKTVERRLLVTTVAAAARRGITLDGRKARIP
ncbi:phosphoribosylglycinamide formyltransferase [Rhodococcus aerolatus]